MSAGRPLCPPRDWDGTLLRCGLVVLERDLQERRRAPLMVVAASWSVGIAPRRSRVSFGGTMTPGPCAWSTRRRTLNHSRTKRRRKLTRPELKPWRARVSPSRATRQMDSASRWSSSSRRAGRGFGGRRVTEGSESAGLATAAGLGHRPSLLPPSYA